MPSPVLHSFAGVALLTLTRDAAMRRRTHFPLLAALIFAANAPDLDFVAGILAGAPTRFHRGASHSLLLAVVFGLAAYLVARWSGFRSSRRFGVLMGLAFTTHIVLDMLSPLGDPRRGVQLAWPFLTERFSFPFRIFIGARYDPKAHGLLEGFMFQRHNWYVVVSEVLLVVVISGLAQLVRRNSPKKGITPGV